MVNQPLVDGLVIPEPPNCFFGSPQATDSELHTAAQSNVICPAQHSGTLFGLNYLLPLPFFLSCLPPCVDAENPW